MREIVDYLPKDFLARQGKGVEELSARFGEGIRRFSDRLDSLSDAELYAPVSPGKWSPAEIADHLLKVNALFIRVLAGAGGEPLVMSKGKLTEDGRPMASEEGWPVAGRAREALCQELAAGAEGFVASAREVQRLDAICLVHAFLGPLTALECLQLASWHVRHHLRQLPEA